MIEQLCYTWSAVGYGSTSGHRIRAVSPGLSDVQSEMVRSLLPYLTYTLPRGSNPYSITPDQAPRGFAFLDHNSEHSLLVHKCYIGKDGIGRPGAFFSHLLSLPQTEKPLRAYEAIELWNSPFWICSENDLLPPGNLEIPSISHAELQSLPRSLSIADLHKNFTFTTNGSQRPIDSVRTLLSAFLMLPTLNKKQIYLAAPPDFIALLIWGLTLLLPRTLRALDTLRFSLYEHDIQEAAGTIVGTTTSSDLSDPLSAYYHSAAKQLAFNFYLDSASHFQVNTSILQYSEHMSNLLLTHNIAEIERIRTQAEEMGIQEIGELCSLFPLESQTYALQKAKAILSKDSYWPALSSLSIQSNILKLILEEPDWWQAKGSVTLRRMCISLNEAPHAEKQTILVHITQQLVKIIHTALHQNDQVQAMHLSQIFISLLPIHFAADGWASMLAQMSTSLPDNMALQIWWQSYDAQIQIAVQTTDSPVLQKAVQAFITTIKPIFLESLHSNQQSKSTFYGDILFFFSPYKASIYFQLELLQDLLPFLHLDSMQTWWSTCYQEIADNFLEQLKEEESFTSIANQCTELALKLIEALCQQIDPEKYQTANIYNSMLTTITPVTVFPAIWQSLLEQLTSEHIDPRKHFHWQLRYVFLSQWLSIQPPVPMERIKPWLNLPWSELYDLLSTPIASMHISWQKSLLRQAFIKCFHLHTKEYADLVPLLDLYSQSNTVLCEIYLKYPNEALTIITSLIEQGYTKKIYLLIELIEATAYNPQNIAQLLENIPLTDEECIVLFEKSHEPFLEVSIAQPVISTLLKRYFLTLKSHFHTEETYFFLYQLMQIASKSPAYFKEIEIDSWYNVSHFFLKPSFHENALHTFFMSIDMLTLSDQEMFSVLDKRLLPTLAPVIGEVREILLILQSLASYLFHTAVHSTHQHFLIIDELLKQILLIERQRSQDFYLDYLALLLEAAGTLIPENPELKEEILSRDIPIILNYLLPAQSIPQTWSALAINEWQKYKNSRTPEGLPAPASSNEEQSPQSAIPSISPQTGKISERVAKTGFWTNKRSNNEIFNHEWRSNLTKAFKNRNLTKIISIYNQYSEDFYNRYKISLISQLNETEERIITSSQRFLNACKTQNAESIIKAYQDIQPYLRSNNIKLSEEQNKAIAQAQATLRTKDF